VSVLRGARKDMADIVWKLASNSIARANFFVADGIIFFSDGGHTQAVFFN